MGKIYFYKLTVDNGGAPCVANGLLSLAICKPMIRKTADDGDLIFGFAANSLHKDNRLVFVARVSRNVRNGDYFKQAKFAKRADCIYKIYRGRFVWRKTAIYHGPGDVVHDLGPFPEYCRANVLLSDDFRYFGVNGSADYKSEYPSVAEAVNNLKQGARVYHDETLRQELSALARSVWRKTKRKVIGRPSSTPSRIVCLRGRNCGVATGNRLPDGIGGSCGAGGGTSIK